MKLFQKLFWHKKGLSLLTVLVISLLFLSLSFAQSLSVKITNLSDELKDHHVDHGLYYLSDNFEGERWDALSGDPQNVEKLISFHEALTQSQDFEYYELIKMPIYTLLADFKGNETFGAHYDTAPDRFYEKGDRADLLSLYVGPNIQKLFDLKTVEGGWFTQEDFAADRFEETSVILGSSYQACYARNDIMPLIYQGKSIRARVIGFLPPDQMLLYRGEAINLNRFVIAPIPSIKTAAIQAGERDFQFKMLLDKNNGILKTSLSEPLLKSKLDTLAVEAGVSPYSVHQGDGGAKESIALLQAVAAALRVVAAFTAVAAGGLFFLLMNGKLNVEKQAVSTYRLYRRNRSFVPSLFSLLAFFYLLAGQLLAYGAAAVLGALISVPLHVQWPIAIGSLLAVPLLSGGLVHFMLLKKGRACDAGTQGRQ